MSNPPKEILDGLTEAEIEALKEDLGEGDAPIILGDDDSDEGGDGGEGGAPAAPAETPKPGETPAEPELSPEDRAQPIAPVLVAAKPDDTALKALDDAEATLEAQFDDGDITASEYRKGLREVADKRATLQWEGQKAELAASMREQAETNAWDADVREFMAGPAAHVMASNALVQTFDAYVRQVTGDAANTGLSNKAQLAKALRLFDTDMGKAFGKPAPKGDAPAPTPTPKGKREIPPTLARVPQADIEDMSGGKFSALDRLAETDPDAYEAAVAKMSASEFEAYSNS